MGLPLIFYFFIIFFTELFKNKSYTFLTNEYFFSLSLAPPLFHCPPRNLSLSQSCYFVSGVTASTRRARPHYVCAFISINSSLFCSFSLSVYLEGEIISNYRENRRRRKLPCASFAGVRTRPAVANRLFGGFRAYLAGFRRHRRRSPTSSVLFVCLLLLDIRSPRAPINRPWINRASAHCT